MISGDYIAADNVTAANWLIIDLFKAFERINDNPNIGRKSDVIGKSSFYFWTVRKRYQIIYRQKLPDVEVVRVINGYWDIFSILSHNQGIIE